MQLPLIGALCVVKNNKKYVGLGTSLENSFVLYNHKGVDKFLRVGEANCG